MVPEIEVQRAMGYMTEDERTGLAYLGGPDALRLAGVMSYHSEEFYFARWLGSVEHYLWESVTSGKRLYDFQALSAADIDEMRALSTGCGAWVFWSDIDGLSLIPLSDWRERHRQWKGSQL